MKKVMITGATSKISLKLFDKLRDKDLEIITCGRSTQSNITVDFNSYEQSINFAKKITEIAPHFLILAHGTLVGKKTSDMGPEEIQSTFNVNLLSNTLILESIAKLENLNTIFISSISGKIGSYDSLYASCKAGIDLLIRQIAPTLPASSRLNAISPGIIADAKMTTVRKDHDTLEKKRLLTPSKQFSSSQEIADLIYYLMFNAQNIHGQNININGGLFVT